MSIRLEKITLSKDFIKTIAFIDKKDNSALWAAIPFVGLAMDKYWIIIHLQDGKEKKVRYDFWKTRDRDFNRLSNHLKNNR